MPFQTLYYTLYRSLGFYWQGWQYRKCPIRFIQLEKLLHCVMLNILCVPSTNWSRCTSFYLAHRYALIWNSYYVEPCAILSTVSHLRKGFDISRVQWKSDTIKKQFEDSTVCRYKRTFNDIQKILDWLESILLIAIAQSSSWIVKLF